LITEAFRDRAAATAAEVMTGSADSARNQRTIDRVNGENLYQQPRIEPRRAFAGRSPDYPSQNAGEAFKMKSAM
jgi:hypothetical protein